MGDRKQEWNQVEDGSRDRAYFVQTPHLVLAACEDLYQLALWTVIKMIAGEDGQCTVSTADLAVLAMMSTGRCQRAREGLLRLGLVEGRLYRDPGYSRPVWHLRIPDLWPANIDWRERHHSLRLRIALKRAQRQRTPGVPGTEEQGPHAPDEGPDPSERVGSWDQPPHERAHLQSQSAHSPDERQRSQDERQRSQGERQRSPDERQRSQGEGQHSPDERQRSPREPKKIPKEEPKEEPQGEPKGSRVLPPEKIWHCALAELEMQMTRATFARWVRPLEFVALERREEGVLAAVVWCPNAYVRTWCAERLDVLFRRTLSGIAEEEVEMVYVVDEA